MLYPRDARALARVPPQGLHVLQSLVCLISIYLIYGTLWLPYHAVAHIVSAMKSCPLMCHAAGCSVGLIYFGIADAVYKFLRVLPCTRTFIVHRLLFSTVIVISLNAVAAVVMMASDVIGVYMRYGYVTESACRGPDSQTCTWPSFWSIAIFCGNSCFCWATHFESAYTRSLKPRIQNHQLKLRTMTAAVDAAAPAADASAKQGLSSQAVDAAATSVDAPGTSVDAETTAVGAGATTVDDTGAALIAAGPAVDPADAAIDAAAPAVDTSAK